MLKSEHGYEAGIQLWTLVSRAQQDRLGPLAYTVEQDEDDEDFDLDEDDARQSSEITERLASDNLEESENFDADEMEAIAANQFLRQAYENRWYRYDNPDTFFVLVNDGAESIMPGEQVLYTYGNRSNRYLLEHYGFVLSDENPYASVEFRIIISTNPKETLASARQLLPDEKTLQDYENIDDVTELVQVKANTLSDELMAYLRSVLMTCNYDGPGKRDIMVSSPSVVNFELVVMKYAIELLEQFKKRTPAASKTTLEQDEKALAASTDFVESTILQYNIQYKSIHQKALKLFQVAKEILERIVEGKEPLTSACFKALECEKGDPFEEVFERRIALHQYFNHLRRNAERIKTIKAITTNFANEAAAEEEKAAKK